MTQAQIHEAKFGDAVDAERLAREAMYATEASDDDVEIEWMDDPTPAVIVTGKLSG